MLFTTLLLAAELLFGASPYRGVVVDAKTNQPVPAASVRLIIDGGRYEGTQGQTTDARGRFQLNVASPTVHLRVSSVGYAPADLTRPLLTGDALDTIRLTAQVQSLAEVTVRPQREVTLQPFSKPQEKADRGLYLIPSVDLALELPPLSEGKSGTLSQVRLQFRQSKLSMHQGGFTFRLLARPDTTALTADEKKQLGPKGKELLPTPITVTAAQIAAAPKGLLTLDLAAYNLAMPENGLFVVLTGFGVTPDQQYVSITSAKGTSALLVTGTDPKNPSTYEVTKLEEYPQLAVAITPDRSITWSRGSNGKGWRLRRPETGTEKVGNAMIGVVVLAD